MTYSYTKIEHENKDGVHYYCGGDDPVTVDELAEVDQFEILDPDGDQLAVVFSEGEAEALISHLNRHAV